MTFDFIEIGTSDFSTEAEKWFNSNKSFVGLSIEPLDIYFDKLPTETSFYFKEQCAISNKEGLDNIYYIHPDIVRKLEKNNHKRLADRIKKPVNYKWRGCNKIGEYHPVHIKLAQQYNIPINEIVTIKPIQIKKFETIIKKYNIQAIELLKIDAEGYDIIILEDFLNYINTSQQLGLLPKKIIFESNDLHDYDKITNIYKKLTDIGYYNQYPKNSVFSINKRVL